MTNHDAMYMRFMYLLDDIRNLHGLEVAENEWVQTHDDEGVSVIEWKSPDMKCILDILDDMRYYVEDMHSFTIMVNGTVLRFYDKDEFFVKAGKPHGTRF